jgi:hypothetical protein
MTGWANPVLTINGLAKAAGVSERWLAEKLRTDPFPTFQRGRQVTVLYSDYIEWARERYGDKGYLRGAERLDPGIGAERKAGKNDAKCDAV